MNLGKGEILEAELWGLFFGLMMAVAKSVSHLIIEIESAIAVQLIHG